MRHLERIIVFTRELWPAYIFISVGSIIVALFTQAIPLLTKLGIDRITADLPSGTISTGFIIGVVVAIFVVDFGQNLVSNITGNRGDRMAAELRRLLSTRYYEHMLKLPQRYLDTEMTGTIINRLNRGVEQLTSYMQFFANNFMQLIISTFFTIGIVAFFAWPVAIVLLILFPLYAWLTAKSSPKWQKYQTKINKISDEASGGFAENVGQIRVVKSFSMEKAELHKYRSLLNKIMSTTRPQSRYWHTQDFIRRLVLGFLFLIMYLIIFVGTARGTYTIGTMVMLIQLIQLVRIPLFSVSFYVDMTQRAITNSKDYFAAMDEPVEHDTATTPLTVPKGAVTFDAVSFGYDTESDILKKLSFAIEPRSKVALVGESGQGKTTITSLLMRFYEVKSGSILIDGVDISTVSRHSLRQNISVVFQEPALFSGTIKQNIMYARPDATEADVIAAAQAANAHEFIMKLSDGYDSLIGERGLKLSGGQKQRIAIARAILKDAPILILDEATSSLDTKSERQVQQALEHLMKNRTTLIIAHRLSTIESVDKIITLKNGVVDETGAPEQLAHSGGIYAQLLELQNSSRLSAKKKLQKYDIAA